MRIAIGANHRGYLVRAMLIDLLAGRGHEIVDLGVCNSRPVDYPDVAAAVAQKVSRGEVERGVLLGGTGMGMCITANKFPGVRAALCHDDMTAEFSRRHNDSNVLCFSASLLGEQLISHITETWLRTPFEGGRHARRLEKIALLEQQAWGQQVRE
jgi:ribose 5-phosphate isomerase B